MVQSNGNPRYLDPELNDRVGWDRMLDETNRLVEVDLNEVERVLELARVTPGLSGYENQLHQLSVFFARANQQLREHRERRGDLIRLLRLWRRYRSVVIQRYTSIHPAELRAADLIVRNIFKRFFAEDKIPNDKIAYSKDILPLVFAGEGGLHAYSTNPPGWNRPFAIISIPHAAFDNVWQWLALPHETGHDLFAVVDGLEEELTEGLSNRMREAVQNGEVEPPDVFLPYTSSNKTIQYSIQYNGEDFLAKLWSGWANEAQADLVGILNCGGAASLSLQQIIRFGVSDLWFIEKNAIGESRDYPEPHPTPLIRHEFCVAALRKLEKNNPYLKTLNDEIAHRLAQLKQFQENQQSQDDYDSGNIVWRLAPQNREEVARMPIDEAVKSSRIAAEFMLDQKFKAFGDKSYRDIATFTTKDQILIDFSTELLRRSDPTFSELPLVEPRHALAATIFAFEKIDRNSAHTIAEQARNINRTFTHFLRHEEREMPDTELVALTGTMDIGWARRLLDESTRDDALRDIGIENPSAELTRFLDSVDNHQMMEILNALGDGPLG